MSPLSSPSRVRQEHDRLIVAEPTLRVCFVAESFYPVGGGVGTFGMGLAERLVDRGFRVMVLTRRESPDLAAEEAFRGGAITVHRIPPVGTARTAKYRMMMPLFRELLRRRKTYDLVYVFGLRVLGPVCVLAGAVLRKPCALRADVSGEVSADFVWEQMRGSGGMLRGAIRGVIAGRNRLLRRAARLVSISDEIHREYLAAGVAPVQIDRIPNGVDVSVFAPADAERRAALRDRLGWMGPTFVFTGRLHPVKGLEVLLQAWLQLVREVPNARLVLIGTGAGKAGGCEDDLKDFVAAHGLQDKVTFAGQVSDVLGYLQAADAFVLPSRREGLSISLLEAMAVGLPVIATRTSGTVEVVTDGGTGRLVDIDDADALYRAMRDCLRHPEQARTMAAAGRALVHDRYSIEAAATRHKVLFEQLCDSGGF